MERQLVKIVGRAEVLGRPMLYGTTKRFLEVFGLNCLEDLPKVEELRGGAKDAKPKDAAAGASAPEPAAPPPAPEASPAPAEVSAQQETPAPLPEQPAPESAT
jgi:segregation and condensation protein B